MSGSQRNSRQYDTGTVLNRSKPSEQSRTTLNRLKHSFPFKSLWDGVWSGVEQCNSNAISRLAALLLVTAGTAAAMPGNGNAPTHAGDDGQANEHDRGPDEQPDRAHDELPEEADDDARQHRDEEREEDESDDEMNESDEDVENESDEESGPPAWDPAVGQNSEDNESERPEKAGRPESVGSAGADAQAQRGPPVDLPSQVPDHVQQIHSLVRQFIDGAMEGPLGPEVSDVTPEDGRSETVNNSSQANESSA